MILISFSSKKKMLTIAEYIIIFDWGRPVRITMYIRYRGFIMWYLLIRHSVSAWYLFNQIEFVDRFSFFANTRTCSQWLSQHVTKTKFYIRFNNELTVLTFTTIRLHKNIDIDVVHKNKSEKNITFKKLPDYDKCGSIFDVQCFYYWTLPFTNIHPPFIVIHFVFK